LTSYWKVGSISGLVAGFVAGIVAIINALIILSMISSRSYFALTPPPNAPILGITTIEITLGLIWGIGLGVIYAKFHDRIPGKGAKKGLVYGLLLFFLFSFRTAILVANTGFYREALGWVSMIHPIVFGLMLGILYGKLHSRYNIPDKKSEIKKYDVKGGIHPGAFAGLVGGIGAYLGLAIGAMLGFWESFPVRPLIHVAGLMMQDMSWGIGFGVLFVFFYTLIPYKGIIKGLSFGLIFYFITSFRGSAYFLAYALFHPSPMSELYFWAFGTWTASGFFHFIGLGLVLGLLYRKPSE
jgi:hypothetical protein